MLQALQVLYRTEGWQGLYRGYVAGFGGVIHAAIQFMAYDQMQAWHGSNNVLTGKDKVLYSNGGGGEGGGGGQSGQHSPMDSLILSQVLGTAALSKIIATVVTYPQQVIRSRMQQTPPINSTSSGMVEISPLLNSGGCTVPAGGNVGGLLDNNSIWRCVVSTWRAEGLAGFYRGLLPSVLKVTPSACLLFLSYEAISRQLEQLATTAEVKPATK